MYLAEYMCGRNELSGYEKYCFRKVSCGSAPKRIVNFDPELCVFEYRVVKS